MKKIYIFSLVIIYLSYLYIRTYKNEVISSKTVYITKELVLVKSINNKLLFKPKYERNVYNIANSGNYKLYFRNNEYIGFKESYFNKIRRFIENRIDKNFTYKLGIYAKALLLYDKSGFSTEEKELLKSIGISHIFSLSGFHLSLIYLYITSMLCAINLKLREIIAISMISIYVLVIGNSPSIIRAYILIAIISLAKLLNEKVDSKKSFFIALCSTLAINPYQIMSISYILSYLVTYIIIVCRNKNILVKNLVIELVTMPIILLTFKKFNLLMFLINIIMIPLFTVFIYILIVAIFLNFDLLIVFLDEYLKVLEYIMYIISKVKILSISY